MFLQEFKMLYGKPSIFSIAQYLFIICQDYKLRTSIDLIKENGFKLANEKNRRYPAQTITEADFADDIALPVNTLVQAESILLSLERAASGTGLTVNADKTEYMCFNKKGDLSTLNWN